MLVAMQNDHKNGGACWWFHCMSPHQEILKHSEGDGTSWWRFAWIWLLSTTLKSWLIVKENKLEEVVLVFEGTNIQISTEGKRHLGRWVERWRIRKITSMTKSASGRKESTCWQIFLSSILKLLTAYVTSYQHNLRYLLQTILNTEDQLKKMDQVVQHKLILAIIGGHIINDSERVMLSLATRLGG